jgi:GMP synthase (glutamine-hydrolysing)
MSDDLTQVSDDQLERILVLDFGSQVSHLICRRVREVGVYCEMRNCLIKAAEVELFAPTGMILSGGPNSVYDKGAPHVDNSVWEYVEAKSLPVLGICYGLQEMCHAFGGKVESGAKREFGSAMLHVRDDLDQAGGNDAKRARGCSSLFRGIDTGENGKEPTEVWMSHGDKVTMLPPQFVSSAYTSSTEFAAVENATKKLYGVQYHPEVTHTKHGTLMIKNFVLGVCGCKGQWNMQDFCKKTGSIDDRRARW